MQEISVIIKPTLACNVSCKHCAVEHRPFVNSCPDFYIKALREIFDFRKRYLDFDTKAVEIIWRGGEPMLLGPSFYENVSYLLEKTFPEVKFYHGMQTNLLLYNSNWKNVFSGIFEWRVGTSYDFFSTIRPYSVEKFLSILKRFQDDSGLPGYVICVLSNENYLRVLDICYLANNESFDLKLNYLYQVGSARRLSFFSPKKYKKALVEVVRNRNQFSKIKIDPIDFFVEFFEGKRKKLPCPCTSDCGKTIFAVYPDGSIYNCAELADINYFCYGNVNNGIDPDIYFSLQMQKIVNSEECLGCEIDCGGGCIKQRILFGKSITKPTPFCKVWKALFKETKKLICKRNKGGSNEF
ncbi:MAG: radical SAM protein [Brevinematia bacterium]